MTGPGNHQRAAGQSLHGNGGVCGDPADRQAAGPGAAASGGPGQSDKRSLTPRPVLNSRGSRRSRHGAVYGALDLGTNNCRLLVARPSRRGFLVIDAFSRIIRLGEGVAHSGLLSEEAMGRTIDALKVCSEKMLRRGVMRSRLIATEACRVAGNSAEFIERVRRETGLGIEIIDRETEAKLAVSGCASLLDRDSGWALVFDIGGGSSELVWLDLTQLKLSRRNSLHDRLRIQDCIVAWTSLPVGVVTLSERYGGRNVDQGIFEAMTASVLEQLGAFEQAHHISRHIADGKAHLLGTSGTVTTVAGVHLGLSCYNRSKVDGCWLDAAEVRAVSQSLVDMTYAERVAQPCIGRDRADLVLAGCAILEAVFRAWPCQKLRVADRGLREGILATLMAEDQANGCRGRHVEPVSSRSGFETAKPSSRFIGSRP